LIKHRTMPELKKTTKTLFYLLLLNLATLAAAQTPSPMTLKDAVEQAILQNPEVKLRFHNLNAAQEERRSAEGGWLPRIDLEAGTGIYNTLSPTFPSATSYSGNRASIQLRQMLFDGMAVSNEVRRLSYAQQASYFELQAVSQQIGLEATRAYVDTLRYRELLELAQENYTTHQEVHDRLAEKVKAGVGRRVDLEQAAGRLALAESNWLTEVSNLHDVSARYQRLVGNTPAETLARLDPMDAYLPVGTEFLGEAVLKNPEFMGAVATIRSYRADMQAKRSLLSPTLELRARQSLETNQRGVQGDYRDTALELVLNYNLYRGGADLARTKQYAAKLESAYDLRDKACRDIWQTGQIAFNDSIRLGSQLKLMSQHELSTSKARQAYQQQFDIGQRSLLDLLDTENELYQARRALANAEHDLQLAEIRVLAVKGDLLSALKLTTLQNQNPQPTGGTENDDGLALCSNRIIPTQTLNRATTSRLTEPQPEPANTTAPTKAPKQPTLQSFSSDAFFDSGASELKPTGMTALQSLITALKQPGVQSVRITGHTDANGSDALNQRLSIARAQAVRDYLQSQGVDGARIKAEGMGKTQPIAENDSAQGRAKNRRVEISVISLAP
jgi:outer membrane protein, adhesin transport system